MHLVIIHSALLWFNYFHPLFSRVSHTSFLIKPLITWDKGRPLSHDRLSVATTPPHQKPSPRSPSPLLKAETNNLLWDPSAGGLSGAKLLITFPRPAAEEMRAFWCFPAWSVTLPYSKQYENIWTTCAAYLTRCPLLCLWRLSTRAQLLSRVNVVLIRCQAKYRYDVVIAVETV